MRAVKISDLDNVAVVVAPVTKGEVLEGTSIKALCDIPQGHKIALRKIRKGEEVIRYGAVLGYMLEDIEAGGWINEFNIELNGKRVLNEDNWKAFVEQFDKIGGLDWEKQGYEYASTNGLLQ